MKTFALFAILLVAGLFSSRGADPKKTTDNYETLRTTEIFAFGGVGVAATRVPAELAFDEIMKADDAAVLFKRLLPTATPEGQLYALVGLHRIDPKAFAAVLPLYLQGTAEIQIARGCILSKEPAKTIVKRIEAGDYK